MKNLKKALNHNFLFWILTIFAVLLIVAGFIVPPLGTIDPSVLTAIGLVLGFCAIDTVNRALEKGVDATIKKDDMELNISPKGNDNN